MSYSQTLFEKAKTVIPGGVNSPVRSFKGVNSTPIFFSKANGAHLYDVDGKSYIDFIGSWGPMILGHQHPAVLESVRSTLQDCMSFGAPCPQEVELANLICALIPSIEKVRMVSSGTEATMTAIRLARGYTGRDKIIKFEGCYHGHNDSLLVKAGSGALTLGQPSSPGIPSSLTKHTLNLPFNDKEKLYEVFSQNGENIAAVIIEPIAGNVGCIPADTEFLMALRKLCDAYGAVLIFDEVITGFRVGLTGAQGHYNITPDLTTLGKIIGGGMPVGAVGGKAAIMDHLAPIGPVYQAGTLSGNPVAMSAGIATLTQLQQPDFYKHLQEKTEFFVNALSTQAKEYDIPLVINAVTGIFSLFFSKEAKVNSFEQAMTTNVTQFQHVYHVLLEKGVYLGPSAYECAFLSSAHDQTVLDEALSAFDAAFQSLKTHLG
ncbi:MAG: glutamate-1-semialdehyde 2,1-aminomutase [Candidatus Berkiella sp.]